MNKVNEECKDSQAEEPEKSGIITIVLLICIAFVIALWIGNLLYLAWKTPNIRGTFGDMFGAVNSLFTGLAFAMFIYTALLQRRELLLMRKQYEKSTKAQKEYAKSMKEEVNLQLLASYANTLASLARSFDDNQRILMDMRGSKPKEDKSFALNIEEIAEAVVESGKDSFDEVKKYRTWLEEELIHLARKKYIDVEREELLENLSEKAH